MPVTIQICDETIQIDCDKNLAPLVADEIGRKIDEIIYKLPKLCKCAHPQGKTGYVCRACGFRIRNWVHWLEKQDLEFKGGSTQSKKIDGKQGNTTRS